MNISKYLLTSFLVVACMQDELVGYHYPSLKCEEDLHLLYLKTVDQIQKRKEDAKKSFHTSLDTFLHLPIEKLACSHVLQMCDELVAHMEHAIEILTLMSYVEPKQDLREANRIAGQELKQELIATFSDKKEIYKTLHRLREANEVKQELKETEKFYLEKLLKDLELEGLHLPDDQRKKVKEIKLELARLSEQFALNIQGDKSYIKVTSEGLKGVPSSLIEGLEKEKDLYLVTCDYPTYFGVMKTCEDEKTRQELYRAFMNRAYPKNKEVLHQMIVKRDQLAQLLGFKSYSHYQLSNEMVKDPETVNHFLGTLLKNSKDKQKAELLEIKEIIPSLKLNQEGKLYPWDVYYAQNKVKETKYQLNQELIKEYFPLATTIKGLIKIFESFFSLKIQEVSIQGLWHEDVKLLKVEDGHTGKKYGYVLLDLFPRENKYSHACHGTLITGLDLPDGSATTSLSLVIANFTKPTASKPSLMTLNEVKTFFHELGHGVHALMGRTQFAGTSGTRVMVDFVELPSQMLEEWLSEPEILRMVSSHYKTHEPLPVEIAMRIKQAGVMASGQFVGGQCVYSRFALECFAPGQDKDTDTLMKQIYEETDVCYAYDPLSHFQASFGHLDEYGARYYGYLWSRVIALDVFEQIKKEGLLNPVAGTRYIKEILGKGGSQHPSSMIRAYLGREPLQEAFLRAYGM